MFAPLFSDGGCTKSEGCGKAVIFLWPTPSKQEGATHQTCETTGSFRLSGKAQRYQREVFPLCFLHRGHHWTFTEARAGAGDYGEARDAIQ